MSEHTPGPWRYQREEDRTIGLPHVRVRFEVYASEGKYGNPASCDSEANARLIAAAPELLEACKALVQSIDSPLGGEEWLASIIELARAAISKAEGGS